MKAEVIQKNEVDIEQFTYPVTVEFQALIDAAQVSGWHVYRDMEVPTNPRRLAMEYGTRAINLTEGDYLVLDGTGLLTVQTAEAYAANYKAKA